MKLQKKKKKKDFFVQQTQILNKNPININQIDSGITQLQLQPIQYDTDSNIDDLFKQKPLITIDTKILAYKQRQPQINQHKIHQNTLNQKKQQKQYVNWEHYINKSVPKLKKQSIDSKIRKKSKSKKKSKQEQQQINQQQQSPTSKKIKLNQQQQQKIHDDTYKQYRPFPIQFKNNPAAHYAKLQNKKIKINGIQYSGKQLIKMQKKTTQQLKRQANKIKQFLKQNDYIYKNRQQFKYQLQKIRSMYTNMSKMSFTYNDDNDINMLKVIHTQGIDYYAPNYVCASLIFLGNVQKISARQWLLYKLGLKKKHIKQQVDKHGLFKYFQRSDMPVLFQIIMGIAIEMQIKQQAINFVNYNMQNYMEDPTIIEIQKFCLLNENKKLANIIQYIIVFIRLLNPAMFWHYLISSIFFVNTNQQNSSNIKKQDYVIKQVSTYRQYFTTVVSKLNQVVIIKLQDQTKQYLMIANQAKISIQLVKSNKHIQYQGIFGYCPDEFKVVDGKLIQGNTLKRQFKKFGDGTIASAIGSMGQYSLVPKQNNQANRTFINSLIYKQDQVVPDKRSMTQKITQGVKTTIQVAKKCSSVYSTLKYIAWGAFIFSGTNIKYAAVSGGLTTVGWLTKKMANKQIKKQNEQLMKDQQVYNNSFK